MSGGIKVLITDTAAGTRDDPITDAALAKLADRPTSVLVTASERFADCAVSTIMPTCEGRQKQTMT
jgi:hypothetical protein